MDATMQTMYVFRSKIGGRLVANIVPEQTSKMRTRFTICFHVGTTISSDIRANFSYTTLNVFDTSFLRSLRHAWIHLPPSLLPSINVIFKHLRHHPDFYPFIPHRSNVSKFLNKMARRDSAGGFGDERQGMIITFYVGEDWAGTKMLKYSNDSRSIVDELKSVRYAKMQPQAEWKSCVVCLEDFAAADGVLKKLGCSHVFHMDCLGPWLDHKRVCPICNVYIK